MKDLSISVRKLRIHAILQRQLEIEQEKRKIIKPQNALQLPETLKNLKEIPILKTPDLIHFEKSKSKYHK